MCNRSLQFCSVHNNTHTNINLPFNWIHFWPFDSPAAVAAAVTAAVVAAVCAAAAAAVAAVFAAAARMRRGRGVVWRVFDQTQLKTSLSWFCILCKFLGRVNNQLEFASEVKYCPSWLNECQSCFHVSTWCCGWCCATCNACCKYVHHFLHVSWWAIQQSLRHILTRNIVCLCCLYSVSLESDQIGYLIKTLSATCYRQTSESDVSPSGFLSRCTTWHAHSQDPAPRCQVWSWCVQSCIKL